MVTEVPTGPDVGDKLAIVGSSSVKFTPLLAMPSTKTLTVGLPLPEVRMGTVTTIVVAFQLVTLAGLETVTRPKV